MTALQWTQARPASIQAWRYLYDLSLDSGRVALALALEAARRVDALNTETSERLATDFQPALDILSPFTGEPVEHDELMLMDVSRLCVESRRFDKGVELLHDSKELPLRYNLGICLFHEGRLDEAQRCFEDSWQQEPRNLVALGWLRPKQSCWNSWAGSSPVLAIVSH